LNHHQSIYVDAPRSSSATNISIRQIHTVIRKNIGDSRSQTHVAYSQQWRRSWGMRGIDPPFFNPRG